MTAINVAAASDQERTEQVVLSELRFTSTPDAEMALSPDDDLDVVVAHVLTSGSLQFRRETVDLLQEHADGFRTSVRRRLVETLALGMVDDNGAVGNATANAVARLCVTTDDRQTWERGVEVLRTGITDGRSHAVSGAAEALTEMATSAPPEAPIQRIREALYAAIINGGGSPPSQRSKGSPKSGRTRATCNSCSCRPPNVDPRSGRRAGTATSPIEGSRSRSTWRRPPARARRGRRRPRSDT
ncbi:hypothetical protein [Halolamina pelagica]|uniref:hypothetical protein n=1 Tax=Halolamina pelagica TaxID=699431 RepID=UPI00118748AE|nr:hypothetical protein [Halolamina pelagica]